jgi:LPXTG-site transpeptidase (sortase) family protein
MSTQSAGSKKRLKSITRILISILGLVLVAGLLFASVTASLAQQLPQAGIHPGSSIQGDSFLLKRTASLTEAFTLTPTEYNIPAPTRTATPTETATYPPTGTATSPATATETSIPTPTNTLTATVTGTPPTPTVTGTLTDFPYLSVSVSPNQAAVNQSFTFVITLQNTGTGPSHNNNIINSYFPTSMSITQVTPSQGTLTKYTRSFMVYIGDLDPNEIVTITFIVKVNSAPVQNFIETETVTLTYDVGQTKIANRTYTVLAQSLPGTGDLPLKWKGEQVSALNMLVGLMIFVLGAILLAFVAWSKARTKKYGLWMAVCGAIMVIVGFVISSITFGWFNPRPQAALGLTTPTYDEAIIQAQPAETTLAWRPASAFSTPDTVIPVVTLPDYPIPTPVITVTPVPGQSEPDTSPVVRIVIPAMLLDTVVKYVPFDGDTWLITGLRQEVAWMGETSWPGLGGNTGLAGHVTVAGMGDGPFRHLDELPAGELVLLYTENNIYTYQVRESRVTDAGDMSVTLPTTNPQVSLITCIDWDNATKAYLNRLVVIADLVRAEPILSGN